MKIRKYFNRKSKKSGHKNNSERNTKKEETVMRPSPFRVPPLNCNYCGKEDLLGLELKATAGGYLCDNCRTELENEDRDPNIDLVADMTVFPEIVQKEHEEEWGHEIHDCGNCDDYYFCIRNKGECFNKKEIA